MAFFEHHGMKENETFHISNTRNLDFPLHFHHAYELIIVHEGELVVTIDQQTFTMKKNDVAFIFNNQMHGLQTIDHSEITIVIFSPEIIGHFFMNYKGYVPKNNIIHLDKLPDLSKLDSIYHQKGLLYRICGTLIEQTEFIPVAYSTKTKILHQILLYVDHNYGSNCTLRDIAKDIPYDYAYLSKLFVQMTNMTYTEYLNHYRISQACYLLKNSPQSITEIAYQCGYHNLRTFNRNFKRITSYSPSNYRELPH